MAICRAVPDGFAWTVRLPNLCHSLLTLVKLFTIRVIILPFNAYILYSVLADCRAVLTEFTQLLKILITCLVVVAVLTAPASSAYLNNLFKLLSDLLPCRFGVQWVTRLIVSCSYSFDYYTWLPLPLKRHW